MFILRNFFKFITFRIRPVIVKGQSMYPTLKDGQLVWVDYTSETIRKVKIGDILLFKNPQGDNLIIKRLTKIDNEKGFWMRGDNQFPLESTDSNNFGYVNRILMKGKILDNNR